MLRCRRLAVYANRARLGQSTPKAGPHTRPAAHLPCGAACGAAMPPPLTLEEAFDVHLRAEAERLGDERAAELWRSQRHRGRAVYSDDLVFTSRLELHKTLHARGLAMGREGAAHPYAVPTAIHDAGEAGARSFVVAVAQGAETGLLFDEAPDRRGRHWADLGRTRRARDRADLLPPVHHDALRTDYDDRPGFEHPGRSAWIAQPADGWPTESGGMFNWQRGSHEHLRGAGILPDDPSDDTCLAGADFVDLSSTAAYLQAARTFISRTLKAYDVVFHDCVGRAERLSVRGNVDTDCVCISFRENIIYRHSKGRWAVLARDILLRPRGEPGPATVYQLPGLTFGHGYRHRTILQIYSEKKAIREDLENKDRQIAERDGRDPPKRVVSDMDIFKYIAPRIGISRAADDQEIKKNIAPVVYRASTLVDL